MSIAPSSLAFDVLVLGGGFAGVYCARELERILGRNTSVRRALVAEENHMVFQPLLAEVAGGSLSAHHVVNPLRLLCRRTEVIKGVVESIDWADRCVRVFCGPQVGYRSIGFRHLVVALGAVVDLSRIPGMPEHAFLMQNVGDAMLLRATVVSRLEEASLEPDPAVRRRLLTIVVVGGGFSGVETAGQILDLVRDAASLYPNIDVGDIHVHLVHSGASLLPSLVAKLSRYCARVLRGRGLELRLNNRVKSVTATHVRLEDGGTIETATVVSTVGNAPHPVVLDLINASQLAEMHGRIVVDAELRVPGHPGLWAAGDCAAVPRGAGGHCPQTAQFAYRQGRLLARNLAATLRGWPVRPFTFRGIGELATVGHHTAVANIFGLNFSGRFAWFLWRSIYLAKLPRFDRKVRVVIDWTLDLFFPRDLTLLSPRYSQVLKEVFLDRGDELFQAGEPAFSLYIVRSGSIELSDAHGVVSLHGPGDYFGERALLTDRRWLFTSRAVEATRLISIPAAVFRQLIGSSGSLGRLFERSASRYQSREVIDAITRRLPAAVLGQPVSRMMRTDLVVLRPQQTVTSALPMVRERAHSSYPLVGEDGSVCGVLRREDLHDFLRRSPHAGESPLSAAGVTTIPRVSPELSTREAVERLVRTGANKLLVVDAGGSLRGIVTVMDLAAAMPHATTSSPG